MFGKKPVDNTQGDLQIFIIHDSKVGNYRDPMYAANGDDMKREIINMMCDPRQQQNNNLYLNSEDFSLFKIGYYSRKSGQITVHNMEHIAYLHELRTVATRKIAREQQELLNSSPNALKPPVEQLALSQNN